MQAYVPLESARERVEQIACYLEDKSKLFLLICILIIIIISRTFLDRNGKQIVYEHFLLNILFIEHCSTKQCPTLADIVNNLFAKCSLGACWRGAIAAIRLLVMIRLLTIVRYASASKSNKIFFPSIDSPIADSFIAHPGKRRARHQANAGKRKSLAALNARRIVPTGNPQHHR